MKKQDLDKRISQSSRPAVPIPVIAGDGDLFPAWSAVKTMKLRAVEKLKGLKKEKPQFEETLKEFDQTMITASKMDDMIAERVRKPGSKAGKPDLELIAMIDQAFDFYVSLSDRFDEIQKMD
jgi:hypothetical protein